MQSAPKPTQTQDILRQKIAVPFEYPVVFTRELWAPTNLSLVDVLSEREPQRRHRALVVLDEGFAEAHPEVAAQVTSYFEAHAARLELVAPPLTVVGGEGVKNDPG